MEVVLTDDAKLDLQFFLKSGDNQIRKKIEQLVKAIAFDPYKGIGKPEQLKNDLSGYWSRRINQEHRIVYTINSETETIIIFSFRGHYEK